MPAAMKRWNKFRSQFKNFKEQMREPGLTALLIVEVMLIFVATPLAAMEVIPASVVPMMFAILIVAILVVASKSRSAVGIVLIAIVLMPVWAFIQAEHRSLLTELLSAVARLLALAVLTYVVAQAVFGPGRVTTHRVQGAVVLYLNFALIFAVLYRLVNTVLPHAFSGMPQPGMEPSGATLLYFSFTTLTTTGFGDIAPLHPIARDIANLESVIGQLYPATLLARLVSLEVEHRRQSKST